MHVSDCTNDDLYKIILDYYYKEGVEYVFYDTLKNDIQHIGDGEEIKKTATVLSNIAQKYKMFIGSTLQLLESTTAPINLTINDMAASSNAHKLEEIAAILGDKVELLSLNDIDCHTDIPETAETLEGNALLKSSFIYRNYQLDCFADDTGLEVEALNGAPGVYSARYAEGEGHDAQANMRKLLHELEGKENRKAQFRTAISLILDGKEYLFEGVIKGEIIKEKRGDSGFG